MTDRFEEFSTSKGLLQAQIDGTKANVVRRNMLVNLENTFDLLPNIASASNQNIRLNISPCPNPTYTISPQIPLTYTPNQVMMMPSIQPSAAAIPFGETKQDQLALYQYVRRVKEIQSNGHKNLDNELQHLRKAIENELQSRSYQSLKYEDLCLHPHVELPLGYNLPKFNTFNGIGDPVAHLKDYCSRLISIGHNEAIRMRLFIQSLSGLALTWYTRQDYNKWHTWEDMASDFVKQYEFNIVRDPHMVDLLKIKKMPHESFQEYAIRWRLEASKIHPPLPEGELISTFIQIQEGIYFDKLLATCARNFSDLIRIGNELECGIQEGRIVGDSITQTINQTFHQKIFKNLQSKKKEDISVAMTAIHPPQCHENQQFLQSYATFNLHNMHLQPNCQHNFQQNFQKQSPQAQANTRQQKKIKHFHFAPLDEPLIDILERLKAKGLLQPRKGFISEHPAQNFDPSKNCAFHSNIQGHDTEDCPALKFKIQSMIKQGKIKIQPELPSNNCGISTAGTIIIKGDPSKLAPRCLKRKRIADQEN